MAKLGVLLLLLALSFSLVMADSDEQKVKKSSSRSRMQPIYRNRMMKGQSLRPAGYEYVPGIGYYRFYPNMAMSYYQAFFTCQMDGAHLAIINSLAEVSVLMAMYARHPNAKPAAYVGFHDIHKEGSYVTIFGQPLSDTGYAKWASGQPDDHEGNEDCGSMRRDGSLNDLWCDKNGPWPFICEYEP